MSHTPTPWRTGSKHPGRIITNDCVIAFVTHPADEGTESPGRPASFVPPDGSLIQSLEV